MKRTNNVITQIDSRIMMLHPIITFEMSSEDIAKLKSALVKEMHNAKKSKQDRKGNSI